LLYQRSELRWLIDQQVTGWKSVFVNKRVTKRIIGLGKDESDAILEYLNAS